MNWKNNLLFALLGFVVAYVVTAFFPPPLVLLFTGVLVGFAFAYIRGK